MPRLPAMLGTETLATVMSSTAMKFAAASTMAAIHSIGPFSGPSNILPVMCFSPCCVVGRASARLRLRTRIDRRRHRQADLQRPRRELGGIELDAHRYA